MEHIDIDEEKKFLMNSTVSCFEVSSTFKGCSNLDVNVKPDKSTPNKHRHEIADN